MGTIKITILTHRFINLTLKLAGYNTKLRRIS